MSGAVLWLVLATGPTFAGTFDSADACNRAGTIQGLTPSLPSQKNYPCFSQATGDNVTKTDEEICNETNRQITSELEDRNKKGLLSDREKKLFGFPPSPPASSPAPTLKRPAYRAHKLHTTA